MKSLFALAGLLLLSACTQHLLAVEDNNQFGLQCSPNAHTAPNWVDCQARAQQICHPLKAQQFKQLPPMQSGSPDDSYFLSFACL